MHGPGLTGPLPPQGGGVGEETSKRDEHRVRQGKRFERRTKARAMAETFARPWIVDTGQGRCTCAFAYTYTHTHTRDARACKLIVN